MGESKAERGNYFEDFRVGQVIATPRRARSRRAMSRSTGAVRSALCHAVVGRFCSSHRLSASADRRPARLSYRVRQDGARHLAQRHRQSRLRRVPVPGAGLSRRHASATTPRSSACGRIPTPDVGRRLRALDRPQPARRDRPRLRALGDGAQARQDARLRRSRWCRSCPSESRPAPLAQPSRRSTRATTIRSSQARRYRGATIRSASGSIISTG